MFKIRLFIIESIKEIRNNISWLNYNKLWKKSILVLVISFFFSIFIGLIDIVFKSIISFFYNSF